MDGSRGLPAIRCLLQEMRAPTAPMWTAGFPSSDRCKLARERVLTSADRRLRLFETLLLIGGNDKRSDRRRPLHEDISRPGLLALRFPHEAAPVTAGHRGQESKIHGGRGGPPRVKRQICDRRVLFRGQLN